MQSLQLRRTVPHLLLESIVESNIVDRSPPSDASITRTRLFVRQFFLRKDGRREKRLRLRRNAAVLFSLFSFSSLIIRPFFVLFFIILRCLALHD